MSTLRDDQSSFAIAPSQLWSAVVGALFIALALQLTLNLLGLGLGLTAVGPTPGQTLDAIDLPWIAGLWWLVSTLVSLFAAGLIVGRLNSIREISDSFIVGGLVWALAALAMIAFATTTIGSTISGVSGILVSTSKASAERTGIDITVGRRGGGGTSASADVGTEGPGIIGRAPRQRAPGQEALRALAWMSVVEAARQLQDPEVRRTIRRMALEVWADTASSRARLGEVLDKWADTGGQLDGEDADALRDVLETVLLVDSATASRLMESWSKQLASVVDAADSDKPRNAGDDGSSTQAIESPPPATKRIPSLNQIKAQLAQAVDESLAVLRSLIQEGGVLGPRKRQQAISDLRRGFETTQANAERILNDWETRMRTALKTFNSGFERVQTQAAEVVETGIDVAAIAAGWAAAALLLGFFVTSLGAFVGGREL